MIQNAKIREEIEAVNWNDNDSIIRFYESNSLYFENKVDFANQDEIIEVVNVKLDYSYALFQKGHYSKSAKTLKQIDSIIGKINGVESNDKLYKDYLFISGMNAHRLKHYKISQTFFEQLLKMDSDNDLYKEWYNSNDKFLFNKKWTTIGYVGLTFGFIFLIFGDYMNISAELRLKLELFGFLVAILSFNAYRIKRLWGKK